VNPSSRPDIERLEIRWSGTAITLELWQSQAKGGTERTAARAWSSSAVRIPVACLLNILLALKSGDQPDIFSYALSAIGATSLLAGLWRQRS
jgi:hypothetical protein